MKYLTHINHQKKNVFFKKSVKKLNTLISKNFKLIDLKKEKNIIISRLHSSRKLLNERVLFEQLKKYNFEIHNFEKLSLQKQIELTRQSKIIIGYQGSGLVNCFFMKKNTYLIDIVNKHIANDIYKIQMPSLKINYNRSNCEISYKNLDGIADINHIESIVKRILKKNKKLIF